MNSDELKGKTQAVKGKMEKALGDLTDDPELQDRGEANDAAGQARDAVGRGRRKVGEAVEDIGKNIKK